MGVDVLSAGCEEKHVIKNMVVYYRYDLMPFIPTGEGSAINSHGVIDGTAQTHEASVQDCDTWWENPDALFPLLIRSDGMPVGLALVAKPPFALPDVDYRLCEFFVLNRFRKRGIGMDAMEQVFRRFPGNWELEYLVANAPAAFFWRRVISQHAPGPVEQTWVTIGNPAIQFQRLRFRVK